MDVTAIVRLVPMHRAAVAVEARVGIGVDADIVNHQHPGILEPHPDKAGEIEHGVVLARRGNEVQCILRIGRDESLDEFAAYLIAVLADQRPDRRNDAAWFGAECFHRRDGGFQNACQRALPAGVGGADHARGRIDQQDRSAVGRGDADRKTCVPCYDGVAARPRRALPRPAGHHGIGRVGLEQCEEMTRRNAHLFCHPATIFRDMRRIIQRADAGIEAGIDAIGYATVAGKEGMAQAGNGREQRGSQRHGVSASRSSVSSLSPANVARSGAEIATTLNIDPMPPRPVPVNRFRPAAISSETSGVVLAIRVTARVSIPSRVRNSPCATGPWTLAPTSSAARASAWKSTWAVTSAWPGFLRGSAKLWRAMAWKV